MAAILQPRFQITRVQSHTIAQLWAKICRFSPLKMSGIQIGSPSDLHYKITPHSDILVKVLQGGILWPQRLEREKNKSPEENLMACPLLYRVTITSSSDIKFVVHFVCSGWSREGQSGQTWPLAVCFWGFVPRPKFFGRLCTLTLTREPLEPAGVLDWYSPILHPCTKCRISHCLLFVHCDVIAHRLVVIEAASCVQSARVVDTSRWYAIVFRCL